MPATPKTRKLWALLGILAFLLLNFPLLEIFNRGILVGGVPLLILYLYLVWLSAIVGLYVLRRSLASRE